MRALQALAPVWSAKVQRLASPVAGSEYGFVSVQRHEATDVMPPFEQTGCTVH